jgi:hypothetical protein
MSIALCHATAQIKPFVGAGILALPKAFEQGGLIGSSILLLLIAGTSMYCMHLLLECLRVMEHDLAVQQQHQQPQQQASQQHSKPSEALYGPGSNGTSSGEDGVGAVRKNQKRKVILFGDVAEYAFGQTGKTVRFHSPLFPPCNAHLSCVWVNRC